MIMMPLIKALEAPGYQISLNAVQSLGQLGDQRAVDPLVSVVRHSRDRLHDAAVAALKRLGYNQDELPQHTEPVIPEPEM
jgi:HEAT repeat protein